MLTFLAFNEALQNQLLRRISFHERGAEISRRS